MASPQSWVILGSVARVSGTDADAAVAEGADLSLALAAPPRVTLLTVAQRVSPNPDHYPMVLAVDPSGLLLLCAPPGGSPTPSSSSTSTTSTSSPHSSPDHHREVTLNITDIPRPYSSSPPPSSPAASSSPTSISASSSPPSSPDGSPVTLNITDIPRTSRRSSSPPPSPDCSPVTLNITDIPRTSRRSSSPPPSPDGSPVTLNITDIAHPRYYVCDATTGTAARLPASDGGFLDDRCAGLIASPAGGGHYMVVELQPLNGSDVADLLCFSSATGRWEEKEVRYPVRRGIWSTDAVFTHAGKLWWVDLSSGLLSCDPFADEPGLEVVKLPNGKLRHNIDCLHCAGRELSTSRCVQASDGKLRCVELTCGDTDNSARPRGVSFAPWLRQRQTMRPSHRKAPRLVMWTLADPETGEWVVEHRVNFADIWADESYKKNWLPKKAPVLALIHPNNADIVYFFLNKHLFGVDLRMLKIVECQVYELVGPSRKSVSSSCVHAWELPPALCAGIPLETDSAVNEETSSAPSNDRSRD